MNSIQRVEFMFEEMNGKFDFLVEAISILQRDVSEMKPMVAHIPSMLQDIRAIKMVAKDHSRQLRNHEARITKLELPAQG